MNHHTPQITADRASMSFPMTTGPASSKVIAFWMKIDVAKKRTQMHYEGPLEGALFEYSRKTTLFQIRILSSITFYKISFSDVI